MSRQETAELQSLVMRACSKAGDLIFRNNVGKGPVAPPNDRFTAPKKMTVTLNRGDVVLRNPSWIEWGLIKGAADLIGIRPVTVTKAMVGQTLGVFLGVEIKAPGDRLRKDQEVFGRNTRRKGGIWRMARKVEDAL